MANNLQFWTLKFNHKLLALEKIRMFARIAKLGNVKHDGKCKTRGNAETQRIKFNLNPKSV